MKRTSLFSKMLLGAAVVTLSFGMQSCKDENKQEDPKEVAEDENEAKFDDTANEEMEDDADFLIFAIFFAAPPIFIGIVVLIAVLCYYEYAAIASAHWIGYGIGMAVLFNLPYAPLVAVVVLSLGLTIRELPKVLPIAAATARETVAGTKSSTENTPGH